MVDRYEALERLSKLKSDGVLTEEEFAAEKAKLLGGPDHEGAAAASSAATMPPAPSRSKRWMWLGPLLVIIVVVLIAIGSRTPTPSAVGNAQTASTDSRLPACDSTDARDLLKNAIEESPYSRVANLRLLDVTSPVERSYDAAKPSRICAADLTLNTGPEHKGYEMHLSGDGGSYLVQLMDDPGPSVAAAAALAPIDNNLASDNMSTPVEPTAAPAPIAASSGDVTAIISDGWLVGRWYDPSRSAADCRAEAGEEGYIEFSADHKFGILEAGGTWRLDGTSLRESGEDEGEPFSSSQVIVRADGGSFSTRNSDGDVSAYQRCPR